MFMTLRFLEVVNKAVGHICIEVSPLLLFSLLNSIYFVIDGCQPVIFLACYTLNTSKFSLFFVVFTYYPVNVFFQVVK